MKFFNKLCIMTSCLSVALLVVRGGSAFIPPGQSFRSSSSVSRRVLSSWTPQLQASSVSVSKETQQQQSKSPPVPITLLSGFLGSGKTTTLKHLLENTQGHKIGVVVNDVASVNIDAKLVSRDYPNQGGTVELKNGCACCSLADELMTTVTQLLQDRTDPLDAVVVELSGVADPVAVQSNWKAAKSKGHPATQLADVKRVVTVVDACTFGTDWMAFDQVGDRKEWKVEQEDCSAQQYVPELLAEQVEAANLILLNKVDLAGSQQVQVASSLARAINDKANLVESEFGKVSPKHVLGSNDNDPGPTTTEDDARKCHKDPDGTDDDTTTTTSHHYHSTSTDHLGISSFVYKRSKPFHVNRLMALLNQWPVPIKNELDLNLLTRAASKEEGHVIMIDGVENTSPFVGVLRSKGFCWFAPTAWKEDDDAWRHETAMFWSHAGKHFEITTAGRWWACINKQEMKRYIVDEVEYHRILAQDFVTEEFGDRRQELVFIGATMDQEEITNALDECLCTDEEMDKYRSQLQNLEAY